MLRRVVVAVLAASLLMPLTATSAFAATQNAACSADAEKLLMWENLTPADTSGGNDNIWFCGVQASVMPSHTIAGTCQTLLIQRSTWNDCVSSITIWLPAGRKVCVYTDVNFGGHGLCWDNAQGGIRWALTFQQGLWNDSISSYRFMND
jgi:hypothetical protein